MNIQVISDRAQEPAGADGYFTGNVYTRNYFHAFDPRKVALEARLFGHQTPATDKPFVYVDFGCAFGFTICLLARAMPHASFIGIDIMQRHIDGARNFARRLGLKNVRFIRAGFQDLAPDDLPPIDYATAHGVLSWVSGDVRNALLSLVAARLKPEGIFKVSHNLPAGWSDMIGIRHLLKSSVEAGMDTQAAARRLGQLFSRSITRQGRAVAPQINDLLSKSDSYLEHEYLSEHWQPFQLSEVAGMMSETGLNFVGPYHSSQIEAPTDQRVLAVDDPMFFEDLYLIGSNRGFHMSLYSPAGQTAPDALMADPDPGEAWFSVSPDRVAREKSGKLDHILDHPALGGAIPVRDMMTDAETRAERRNTVLAAVFDPATYALNGEWQPAECEGAFEVTDPALARLMSLQRDRDPGDRFLVMPASGAIASLPPFMWWILERGAGQSPDTYPDLIRTAAVNTPEPDAVARCIGRWHSQWAPWLAGQGVIRPQGGRG